MFILDGMVYGGQSKEGIKVKSVKPLDDMMMIITFESGETRLFDASILDGEVFEPLKNQAVFKSARVEYGAVVWLDGEIDCAPEFMYDNSYDYTMVS